MKRIPENNVAEVHILAGGSGFTVLIEYADRSSGQIQWESVEADCRTFYDATDFVLATIA